MTEKTKGIVIHFTRYSDSSGIVNVLTERYGRQAYLARGTGRSGRGTRNVIFQPLMILEIEASHKPGRDVHNMRSCYLSHVPVSIHCSVTKSAVAIFLAEVLDRVIREEVNDTSLYAFIEESVIGYDSTTGADPDFHLKFMAKLTRLLGFGPTVPADDGDYLFDVHNGVFCFMPPAGGNYMNHEQSRIFRILLGEPVTGPAIEGMTGTLRREMLTRILGFYDVHIPGFKNLKSAKILREVFS